MAALEDDTSGIEVSLTDTVYNECTYQEPNATIQSIRKRRRDEAEEDVQDFRRVRITYSQRTRKAWEDIDVSAFSFKVIVEELNRLAATLFRDHLYRNQCWHEHLVRGRL